MQISNSVSFGAILNRTGLNALRSAKLVAKIYDNEMHTNRYTERLKESLKTIRSYKNNTPVNVCYEDPFGYDDEGAMHSRLHKARVGNKIIYEDLGCEYEFFTNFAQAIRNNKIFPRDLNFREIEEDKRKTNKIIPDNTEYVPSKKTVFIGNTYKEGHTA